MHKSHLSEPARLMRLLMASCLAYIWLVYLGVCALRDGWLKRLHRQDRCDLSLFRLGLRLLARCLKDDIPIPEGFLVPVQMLPQACSSATQTSRMSRTHFLYGSEYWSILSLLRESPGTISEAGISDQRDFRRIGICRLSFLVGLQVLVQAVLQSN